MADDPMDLTTYRLAQFGKRIAAQPRRPDKKDIDGPAQDLLLRNVLASVLKRFRELRE